MADNRADVLLISNDRQFWMTAGRHRPSGAQLAWCTPEEVARGITGGWRQVWVDFDTAPGVTVPDAARRVYFYSEGASLPEHLPAGMHIRKPCADVVYDVLWADATSTPIEQVGRTRADVKLPAWLLDFQDLRLGPLCRKLVTGLAPRLGYRDVSLYLHDPTRGILTLAETTHTHPIELAAPMDAPGQFLMVAVARAGRVFRTDHAREEMAVRGIRRPAERTYADGACLIAPLCSEGQVWGVLNFSGAQPTAITETDLPLDELFAFLGRTVEFARAYDAARTEARVDGLTGLYNQRWMAESLEREVRRAERFSSPLSVVMIDLDGLKGINDRDGHAAGDCVLRHIASRITRVLRQFDGAARIGGDEFVVMLPGTDLRGGQRVARRLLESIRTDAARFRDKELTVTASLGVAQWRAGLTAERLLEAADAAMYKAKNGGRNGCGVQPRGQDAQKPDVVART